MSLSVESSNIASIPFVAMALQTQEEINSAYMRKMNRGYSTYAGSSRSAISPSNIRNLFDASESHLQSLQYRITPNQETDIE